MEDKLLPCPFCGGEAKIDYKHDIIKCDECLVTMEAFNVYPSWHIGNELMGRWNTRAEDINYCSNCGAKVVK